MATAVAKTIELQKVIDKLFEIAETNVADMKRKH
jgi:hypothetical protein